MKILFNARVCAGKSEFFTLSSSFFSLQCNIGTTSPLVRPVCWVNSIDMSKFMNSRATIMTITMVLPS